MKLKEIIKKLKDNNFRELILELFSIICLFAGLILFVLSIFLWSSNILFWSIGCGLIWALIAFRNFEVVDDKIYERFKPFDRVRYKPTNEEGIVKRINDGFVEVIFLTKSYPVLCNHLDLENLTREIEEEPKEVFIPEDLNDPWEKCKCCEYFDGYDMCLHKKNFGAVTNESEKTCNTLNLWLRKR